MIRNHKLLPLLALGLGLIAPRAAQAQQERALPVLTQGYDARSAALGHQTYGQSRSAALYANPTSALYGTANTQLSAYYHGQQLEGEPRQSLTGLGIGASHRFGRHALMLGTRYYGGLRYTEVSTSEKPGSSRSLYDQSIDAAYALRLGHFSAYASLSYIFTRQLQTASTITASLGASYRDTLSAHTTYVATAKAGHLGSSFTYAKKGKAVYPPSFLGLGGELTHTHGRHAFTGAASLEHYLLPSEASSTRFALGAEYAYAKAAARLGYAHDSNGLSAFTLGVGARLGVVQLDLAASLPNNSNATAQYLLSASYAF